ncbi:MAG: hypothetical protein JXB49_22705 [Bacteroidales bacterium]|nr:hypothetical protein [Bacteroidales bacterium]
MKLIIPMAGMGTRLRPHTLTTPKPLIKVYGKAIVFHLIDEILNVMKEEIEEIAFVVGHFGETIEKSLIDVAKSFGSKGKIYYQEQPKGTAHAVYCAKDALDGKVVVAFADTIFKSKSKIDSNKDGIIWVKEVKNPSAYGVVTLENEFVSGFVEKPKTPVSNKAIIGIYYFNDGKALLKEIEYLIKNKVTVKGEYQLTDALENLRKKGKKLSIGYVDNWMDCGSKETLLNTSKQLLDLNGSFFAENSTKDDSVIIEPCYIGKDVTIKSSTIGPYVSVGEGSYIESTIISDSLVMGNCNVLESNIKNSILGNNCEVKGIDTICNLGDYSTFGR